MPISKVVTSPKYDYTITKRSRKRTDQDNLWAYTVSRGKYNTLRKLMTAINKGDIVLVEVKK